MVFPFLFLTNLMLWVTCHVYAGHAGHVFFYTGPDCKLDIKGHTYAGNIMNTVTGRTCQRWNSQSPHQHNQQAANFPERHLGDAGSYCRNPDNKPGGPWCYTTEPVWEYCNISLCQGRFVE
jgi:hypothetical protein